MITSASNSVNSIHWQDDQKSMLSSKIRAQLGAGTFLKKIQEEDGLNVFIRFHRGVVQIYLRFYVWMVWLKSIFIEIRNPLKIKERVVWNLGVALK